MAFQISFLFILTGLTGIHVISAVREVSVKSGNSISIPCLYNAQYIDHVKYLCGGHSWASCSYKVKTNQQSSNSKFSIFDDKKQRTFTVTIKDVTGSDLYYWCAVEINGGTDVSQYVPLSVTKDTPSLYVDHQEVTVFKEDPIEISCYHRISGGNKWCRLGGSCVTKSSGVLDGTIVTIIARSRNSFTVTMSGLRTESSGWYACVKGEFQMPVHITVTEQPVTTFASSAPTTVDSEQRSAGPEQFLVPLSLLILLVIATVITWFLLKRHKKTTAESSATTTADEVTYSTVPMRSKPSSQVCPFVLTQSSDPGSDVIYSSVVIMDKTKG